MPALRVPALAVAAALACLLAAPARADLWAYVDARGVAHFAAEKLDDRYELFFRGGPAAEPTTPVAPVPAPVPQPDGRTSRLAAFIEASPGYREASPLLREASSTHRIDYELLKALVAAESGFDPQAVSPKGAVGLMQVLPATAERFGVAGDARAPVERKLVDPRTNVRAGSRYLRHLMDLFPGRLDLALAAYNAGEGAVQRAGQRIPDFRETQNYVRTVMQLYTLLKPPAARADATRAAAPSPRPAPLPGAVPGRSHMPPPLLSAVPPLSPAPQNTN